ncbi:MAG: hypothetical protein ABSB60_03250 [Terracidiphilus sp.]|jgi:hypothetical protein
MHGSALIALAALISAAVSCRAAQPYLSVDTGECGTDTPTKQTVVKSRDLSDQARAFKAYGRVSFQLQPTNSQKSGCHVTYDLFVSTHGGPFEQVRELNLENEAGEIAGIDLIGLSPDGSKFAADFWLAEGDGEEHRPVVYDLVAKQSIDLPLEDKIQRLIHGCDQNEDFVGVTNSGEAIFAIPPSEYYDSPACGDKGLWHFNLETGKVYRVAKISGVKLR